MPEGKLTMVCAVCDQSFEFTLDQMKTELDRTIDALGGASLTTLEQLTKLRIEWVCKTCDEGAAEYLH